MVSYFKDYWYYYVMKWKYLHDHNIPLVIYYYVFSSSVEGGSRAEHKEIRIVLFQRKSITILIFSKLNSFLYNTLVLYLGKEE